MSEPRPAASETPQPAPSDTADAPNPPEEASASGSAERDAAHGPDAGEGEQAPPENRPFDERVAEDEREERQRRESLRSLEAGGLGATTGRDWIGSVSNEVSGGTLQNAGRDFYIFEAAKEERLVRVRYMPEETAKRLTPDRIASVPSLPELQLALEHTFVVQVRGADGTGRLTAALAALLQWCRQGLAASVAEDETPVGVVQVEGSLDLIRPADLRPRHGYVIDVGAGDQGRRLDAELTALESLAVKHDCRLVLIIPAHGPAPSGTVIEHRPPGAAEVFRRWFAREAAAYGVNPVLAEPARRMVEEQLAGETSPQRAVDHACRLVHGLAEGRPAEEVCAEFPDRVRDDVRHRLSARRPILGRCFMASVAVLHGMQETTVSRAAIDLADRIDAAWRREERRRPLPTWEDLQEWLEYAGAATRSMPTGGGRIVELRQRTRARTTLQVLWEEQPTIREPLMDWLDGLAHGPETEIRAAHAVGLLATFDFAAVDERFLGPWSRSQKFLDQSLAAWVLEAAAREPALERRVREHLRGLARGRYGEIMVAVRAHGSHLGTVDLTDSLSVFETASRRQGGRGTVEAIARSVSFLFAEDTSLEIVGALADWTGSEHDRSRLTAAVVFLRLAALRPRPGRPELTELAGRDGFAGHIVRLWRHALRLRFVEPSGRERPAAPEAWRLFAHWMAACENAPALRPVIERVVAGGGAEDDRLRAAFRLHARLLLHRGTITPPAYRNLLRLVPAQPPTGS